uniref:Uncharacterized protein n=1 Tax=Plectus sambesii TaxID=2011161 RepID=A0A914ULC7_9BILA
MLLQANKTDMAEIQMAMNNQCVEHARRTSLQSASNGEQKSLGGKRKRGASPNIPQNTYKRAPVARKGEGSIDVNSEDTINQTVAQHVGNATRDGDDTAFGLVTVSNISAPVEMISLVIDGGRQPSYQSANNVESDHQCESNNHGDQQEGNDDNDDDDDDDDDNDNDDDGDKHEDGDDNHEDANYYDNVVDEIANSMYSQVMSATSPLPSETSGRSFEQGLLVTPTMSQRSVELAPLLMPTTIKSILQPTPVSHAASWQTDSQQAYSELPRQPIVIQQQHEQMNTPLPPPPQPHNEQDLQSYRHAMETEMRGLRQELAEALSRNNQHGQDVQLVNVQQTTTSQVCISQPEEVFDADNDDDNEDNDAIQDQESVAANYRQRMFTKFITDPVTRKKLNPYAAPVYAAVYTPPSRDSNPSTAARKLAAVKKAIRRGNQILLKEFGIEAENLKTDMLNQSDLKDIGNAIDREIVLFKE